MKKYSLKLTVDVSYDIDPTYYKSNLLMQDILDAELEEFKENPEDFIYSDDAHTMISNNIKFSGNIEKKKEVE